MRRTYTKQEKLESALISCVHALVDTLDNVQSEGREALWSAGFFDEVRAALYEMAMHRLGLGRDIGTVRLDAIRIMADERKRREALDETFNRLLELTNEEEGRKFSLGLSLYQK